MVWEIQSLHLYSFTIKNGKTFKNVNVNVFKKVYDLKKLRNLLFWFEKLRNFNKVGGERG